MKKVERASEIGLVKYLHRYVTVALSMDVEIVDFFQAPFVKDEWRAI